MINFERETQQVNNLLALSYKNYLLMDIGANRIEISKTEHISKRGEKKNSMFEELWR